MTYFYVFQTGVLRHIEQEIIIHHFYCLPPVLWIRDVYPPDPNFYPSRAQIQQQEQKRKGKNSVVLPFFAATNMTK